MSRRRTVAIVTGTRAEFGLLAPVIEAIRSHEQLDAQVIVAGAHLLAPARTWHEVAARYEIAARIEMQRDAETGSLADAASLGRGIEGMARVFAQMRPDWALLLGDRIEALAAAAAGSVGAVGVAQIHAGDRAEGVADEAMRHAITKLAHLHLCATEESRRRVVRMGEREATALFVGSPAVDAACGVEPLGDAPFAELGAPGVVVLHHPAGLGDEQEDRAARAILGAIAGERALWLDPNHDPGRGAIVGVIQQAKSRGIATRMHLEHATFLGLLRRMARAGGVLIGNSSCALIEGAIIGCRAVDIGPRQAGRERPANVVHAEGASAEDLRGAIERARGLDLSGLTHPYGEPGVGERIASALAQIDPADPALLRKRNAY